MYIRLSDGSAEDWCCEDLLDEDDVTDKVSIEKLQLLGSDTAFPPLGPIKCIDWWTSMSSDSSWISLSDQSKELRDVLCNPHLRQLLRSIDSADNKYDAMKSAMQEPLFVEFSDRCLKIVENKVLTRHESDDDF